MASGNVNISGKLFWSLAVLLAAGVAHADGNGDLPSGFSAQLVCKTERSYALCMIPVSPAPGWRITFAEANLLKSPPFLRSVATRSTYNEGKGAGPQLKLGFVVTGSGSGEVVAQARVMLCSERTDWCDHQAKVVSKVVSVSK